MRRARPRPHRCPQAGFGLIDVTLAIALLAVLFTTVSALVVRGRVVAGEARRQLVAVAAARARLDELLALPYSSAELASGATVEITDYVTDLSGPAPATGGPGLAEGPADSLESSRPGYVDHLDADGRWVGAGASAPAGAAFTRRWSIVRGPAITGHALLVQVVVMKAADSSGSGRALQGPGVVRLVAARARRMS